MSMLTSTQKPTITYTISDDETLEVALTENFTDTPVTDLDSDMDSNQSNKTLVLKAEVGPPVHDMTVNDILDTAGQRADDTLALALDETDMQTSVVTTDQTHRNLAPNRKAIQYCEDEDIVFRSTLEISLPNHVRRSRTRSRQEEMEDLQGLSQLAEHVLRTNEEDQMRQQSQELSDLATQVLDFCSEPHNTEPDQLADLSDLLAHYDTIKQQQRAIQLKRAQITNGRLPNEPDVLEPCVLRGLPPTTVRPPTERASRKPLIRPALPALTVSKERLLDWNVDSCKSDNNNRDRRAMADSGIDVMTSDRMLQVDTCNTGHSSSDGYSSENDGSVNTTVSHSVQYETLQLSTQ